MLRVLLIFLCFMIGVTTSHAESNLNSYPAPKFSRVERDSLHSDFFVTHIWEQLERPLYIDRVLRWLLFKKVSARNLNAEGDIEDKNFFENRIATKSLTPLEVKKGNILNGGPDLEGKLTVVKAKSSGLSTGIIVKDSRGDKYLLKLDQQAYPELLSAAEIIGARLFYALGYHVPEYTIARFRFDQLVISQDVKFYDETGFLKPLTIDGLRWILRNSSVNANQEYRASASKYLEGIVLGPMSFRSRRREDPQDMVLHEHRRELRGLRVFCSWLNHFDLRRQNTLDVLIQEKDGWFIKHYLIDFAASLGSYISGPKTPQLGYEYILDMPEIIKSFFSLGFYSRPWRYLEPVSPFYGYFTNTDFNPGKWKTHMPNYAFQNMTIDDAMWAVSILECVEDSHIRAAVEAAELTNVKTNEVLTQKLIQRRDMIIRYWQAQQTL